MNQCSWWLLIPAAIACVPAAAAAVSASAPRYPARPLFRFRPDWVVARISPRPVPCASARRTGCGYFCLAISASGSQVAISGKIVMSTIASTIMQKNGMEASAT